MAEETFEDVLEFVDEAEARMAAAGLVPVGRDLELPASQIIALLEPYLVETRIARLRDVVGRRTETVVPVMEGLYDRGNVSAVIRSAESLGFQQLHLIETQARFRTANRTTKGCHKWVDLYRWTNTPECVAHLKGKGYRIVATHLDATAVPIEEIDFTVPTALVFGNEQRGITPEMIAASDIRCIIPMQGFSQSFNISVAAALSLYHVYRDRMERQGRHGDLSPERFENVLARFYMKTLDGSEKVLKRLHSEKEEKK